LKSKPKTAFNFQGRIRTIVPHCAGTRLRWSKKWAFGRWLLCLGALVGLIVSGAVSQAANYPTRVRLELPEGFYVPAPKESSAKVPLSVALVADPAFMQARFRPSGEGEGYEIELQPALLDALRAVLAANFKSVQVVSNEAAGRSADLVVEPSVVFELITSPQFFKQKLTVRGALMLVVKETQRMREVGEFIRIKTVSAEGSSRWELGNYWVSFDLGGDNGALLLKLVEQALSDDLAAVGADFAQSKLALRVAQLRSRAITLPPDVLVPQIPYVPATNR